MTDWRGLSAVLTDSFLDKMKTSDCNRGGGLGFRARVSGQAWGETPSLAWGGLAAEALVWAAEAFCFWDLGLQGF